MNSFDPRPPRHSGQLGRAFEHYLGVVYRSKVRLLPPGQRSEVEQAFNAGVQFLLVQLGTSVNRGAPRIVLREQLQDYQDELDRYSSARLLELGGLRLVHGGKPETPQ